jgi:hypothetical protein
MQFGHYASELTQFLSSISSLPQSGIVHLRGRSGPAPHGGCTLEEMPPGTVSELLATQRMPRGAVVLVDEAGQIGAQQMLELLKLVQANGGRVILSGNTRQYGAVEASDALRAIEIAGCMRLPHAKVAKDAKRGLTGRTCCNLQSIHCRFLFLCALCAPLREESA